MSEYEQRKFEKAFRDGCEFWTSEDGTRISIAIMDSEGWQKRLVENNPHIFSHQKHQFDETRCQRRFVYQAWAGREYFDGPYSCQSGKVWRLTDSPSPYPVIDYNLLPKD